MSKVVNTSYGTVLVTSFDGLVRAEAEAGLLEACHSQWLYYLQGSLLVPGASCTQWGGGLIQLLHST